jgi:hypothetical protein
MIPLTFPKRFNSSALVTDDTEMSQGPGLGHRKFRIIPLVFVLEDVAVVEVEPLLQPRPTSSAHAETSRTDRRLTLEPAPGFRM